MATQDVIRRLLGAPAGERALTLADIGAMGGLEPEWAWLRDEGLLKTVGFEPDDREFGLLPQDARTLYHPCALWSEAGKPLTLRIAREPGKTSLLEPNLELLRRYPNPERFETVRTAPLPPDKVRTLDDLKVSADFLKLDTQGTELDILRGGARCLDGVLGLKVEVEFLELYRGQPLFAEVDSFLRGRGFELTDLRRVYWKRRGFGAYPGRGQLAFGDALYFRPPEAALSGLSGEALRGRGARLAASLLVYGAQDQAHEACRLSGLAEAAEAIAAGSPLYGVRLPGRGRLLRWMRGLSRLIARSDQGFADADAGLGNL